MPQTVHRKPIAFLTMDRLDAFVVYDHLAKSPLADRGWQVIDVPWRDPAVCWDDYEAVIIRSPWDYHQSLADFLQVIDAIEASQSRLFNSASIVRWNVDKTYLQDLQRWGVATIPTVWIKSPDCSDILKAMDHFRVEEIVIKPTIGAGARDTHRVRRSAVHLLDLAPYQGHTTMLQPFLASITDPGEWSLFYFGGKFSHAVLKTPKVGDFRVQEEFGSRLQPVTASAEMLAIASQAMNAIIEPTLYARIDLVQISLDEYAVIELELIEPSLYFPYAEDSAERFADAVDCWLREPCDAGAQGLENSRG
jgi:glutathione synthase/RimK-type ligase-like ATP-grasp enzyme